MEVRFLVATRSPLAGTKATPLPTPMRRTLAMFSFVWMRSRRVKRIAPTWRGSRITVRWGDKKKISRWLTWFQEMPLQRRLQRLRMRTSCWCSWTQGATVLAMENVGWRSTRKVPTTALIGNPESKGFSRALEDQQGALVFASSTLDWRRQTITVSLVNYARQRLQGQMHRCCCHCNPKKLLDWSSTSWMARWGRRLWVALSRQWEDGGIVSLGWSFILVRSWTRWMSIGCLWWLQKEEHRAIELRPRRLWHHTSHRRGWLRRWEGCRSEEGRMKKGAQGSREWLKKWGAYQEEESVERAHHLRQQAQAVEEIRLRAQEEAEKGRHGEQKAKKKARMKGLRATSPM